MKLVAWQNMLSPHQQPLLNALADSSQVDKLTLIVEQEMSQERANMGWTIPDFSHLTVIVAPQLSQLDELKTEFLDSTHLVSGFAQGRYGEWIRQNIPQFFLYSELAKSDNRWRRFANVIRYRWFYRRMADQVKGIFAIGSECPIWLKESINIEPHKILPFGYFMKANAPVTASQKHTHQVLFVGRLEPVKGIVNFVQSMLKADCEWQLSIVGDGSQRQQLELLIADHDNIKMLGTLPQTEILTLMQDASVLVLPNQKEEGWGFVVNEALMNGTSVFCSDLTGARQVVSNAPYCMVNDHTKLDDMVRNVTVFMEQKYSTQQRLKLQKWYNQCLSVETARDYMLDHFMQRQDLPINKNKRTKFGWL